MLGEHVADVHALAVLLQVLLARVGASRVYGVDYADLIDELFGDFDFHFGLLLSAKAN